MRQVSRSYGDLRAVDDVSLVVPAGTILGVIGPSGSGKTTIIRMLTGTLAPTAGTLEVLGEQPRKFHHRTRERIGYMPQQFVLYPELTAAENVSFVASLFGLLWRQRKKRVEAVLRLVELWDARNRRASQLSGGMQRRLELACALVHDPVLLFVDEPTAGLDPILRQTIWSEFRTMRDHGRTLVVTTQYVGEAEYCDQVAVIAEGRLVALGAPEDLRRQALGGDMLEIRTSRAFDGALLQTVPGVLKIRQTTPRNLLITATDGAAATPRLLEAITAQGVEVEASSEYRPNFDEVFADLVSRPQPTPDTVAGQPQTPQETADVPRAA